jgi:hypothetical protein
MHIHSHTYTRWYTLTNTKTYWGEGNVPNANFIDVNIPELQAEANTFKVMDGDKHGSKLQKQ